MKKITHTSERMNQISDQNIASKKTQAERNCTAIFRCFDI